LEEPGADARKILRRIFRKLMEGHGLDYLAQDRGRCRALVKAVINLRVP
jgi:hypothetical protein